MKSHAEAQSRRSIAIEGTAFSNNGLAPNARQSMKKGSELLVALELSGSAPLRFL